MDQEMIRLVRAFEKYGIINPLIVRDRFQMVLYEIISGHRRKAAAEKFPLPEGTQ